ncbi:MAG: 3-isopropylmalate dehydrogenase [Alphaproteobacteria bacterium]|nr:3-isopropylmalate dehydrogenase [Alphaproteobacteria bacterium]
MAEILLTAGDGIGPEIMEQAKRILHCFAKDIAFTLTERLIGGAGIDAAGSPFPTDTQKAAAHADAVLFGAVGGPKWDNLPLADRPEKGILGIRKALGLYANLRPTILWPQLTTFSPLKQERIAGVDLLIMRELTGDIYFGEPRGIRTENGQRIAHNTMVYSEEEIRRIAIAGFEAARKRRKKLCSVDKSNVLETMRFWREIVTDIHKDYPDVTLEHMYVDNAAMQIILRPAAFDVMLTPNMFGDILSDEAAVLAGSLGLLPSASIGGKSALYEPIHGSAPDIAGQGLANPIGMILCVGMMLGHSFNKPAWEQAIRAAVGDVLDQGLRTADIMSDGMQRATTDQMGSAIETALRKRLG